VVADVKAAMKAVIVQFFIIIVYFVSQFFSIFIFV